jgi:transposase
MSEDIPRHPGGRPSEYDPAYCDAVIELGKAGKSRAQIASALNVSRQTLINWGLAHPEFLDALQRAKDEELAWWEGQAQEGLNKGSSFNAAIWAKSVSGRFPAEPYRERVQVTGAGDGPVRTLDLSKVATEDLDQLERILEAVTQVDEH